MNNLNLFTAFAAGVVSFLSPCVLPLIPGYISFVSGLSLADLRETEAATRGAARRAFVSSLWFVLGFSLVFVALGASATVVGKLFLERLNLFRQVAGVVIVLFGLHLIGIVRIPFLLREAVQLRDTLLRRVSRPGPPPTEEVRKRPLTSLGALVVGAAFAFGWTPCIGPILAGVLALASTQESLIQGMGLLTAYSLGLGIPFLATSLGVERFLSLFQRFRRYLRGVEVVSGLLLVAIGILIFTDRLTLLARYLSFFNRFAL